MKKRWETSNRIISSMSLADGCYYCGKEATTWDHIVPQKLGGSDDIENLVPCCSLCNSIKGAKPLYEFRKHLKTKDINADFDTPEPRSVSCLIKKDLTTGEYHYWLDGLEIDAKEYLNHIFVNARWRGPVRKKGRSFRLIDF